MRKGAPFAGYEDFDACVRANSGKDDPEAYCGKIKHQVEDNKKTGASSLPQIQQVVDPNNNEVPQDDQLPEGVMFPIDPAFGQRWVTGPEGAQPMQAQAAQHALPTAAAIMFGNLDAQEGNPPRHKNEWAYSRVAHGQYLRAWNNTAGLVHGLTGRSAMAKDEYARKTGRPDLHKQYLAAYAEGRRRATGTAGPESYEGTGEATASLARTADQWSMPHSTTDDEDPPYNTEQTTPDPDSQNDAPQSGDYSAGLAAGRADRSSGQRPAFADNSSGVSQYVKGYAEGYGGSGGPQGAQDVPASMGGDSGQPGNIQEAQQAFQVARASKRASLGRFSAAFAPDLMMRGRDFASAYRFAKRWGPGFPLVKKGSAEFEAGLYAGISDRDQGTRSAWIGASMREAARSPEMGRRIALHASFTGKFARRDHSCRISADGVYLQRAAGVSTDLITDGPGTSPDPMGSTPLNGPGTPPPMAGRDNANAPAGPPPYQGAPPQGSGPVVPDDVVGRPQEQPQQSGPFTNTFSGNHPENATLAPVAPDSAAQPGYTNPQAYGGDPRGGDKLAAFRTRVQAGLAKMGAFDG